MNNKGFAVTAVIYGLAVLGIMIVIILMGILSSSRRNVKEEAQSVEEMLLSYNKTSAVYRYGSGETFFETPRGESGWYRIEAYGPSCSTIGEDGEVITEYGAFTTGKIYLKEGEALLFEYGNCGTNTVIKVEDTPIMVAAAATSQDVDDDGDGTIDRTIVIPGGGLHSQNQSVLGGNVSKTKYSIEEGNLIGSDDIEYDPGYGNTSKIIGFANGTSDNEDYEHFFVDGLMLPGGSGLSTGEVHINILVEEETLNDIPIKNSKFKDVENITISSPTGAAVVATYLSHENGNEGKMRTLNANGTTNVGGINIDDIYLYFPDAKKETLNVRIELDSKLVYDSNHVYGTIASSNGIHLSAYQPDTIPQSTAGDNCGFLNTINNFATQGEYYIIPVMSDNKVVTAAASAEEELNNISIERLKGTSTQKWSVELITTSAPENYKKYQNISNTSGKNEYKITELARGKALTITKDENKPGGYLSSPEMFNTLSINKPQIWNVIPMCDGTVAIKTIVPSFKDPSGTIYSGFLTGLRGEKDNLVIGLTDQIKGGANDASKYPTNSERFILYSLDLVS